MANIKKYTKKDGSSAYMFNAYLGVDPVTGKSKRTTRRGFRTQKEAKLALSRLELEIDTKGFAKQNFSTFKDVYELWFSQYELEVKKVTSENTERMFRHHILPKLGDIRLNKLSRMHCQNAVNEWASYYSATGLLKSLTSKMFKYAVVNNLIENNPMEYVSMPKKDYIKKEEKLFFLELSELKELLKNAKEKFDISDYTLIRLLAFSGARKGEIYALNWRDVDFNTNTLSIDKTLSWINGGYIFTTPKNKFSVRKIIMDDVTVRDLKLWKTSQKREFLELGITRKKDSEQLVFSRGCDPLFPIHVNRLLSELDDRIYPHILRHTHASLLFDSGANIKDVQKRLGHSDIGTTMNIYTHVTKDSEKKVLKKLNQLSEF